jgi:hypothetical protein
MLLPREPHKFLDDLIGIAGFDRREFDACFDPIDQCDPVRCLALRENSGCPVCHRREFRRKRFPPRWLTTGS